MELNLTAEQINIRSMARDFAQREVAPLAARLDATCEVPMDNIRKMGSLGFLGLTVPESYGGCGLDALSCTLVIEEIARACASTAAVMMTHEGLVNYVLVTYGTEEQKRKYLTPLAQGQKIGAFALTEPGAGSDAAAIRTSAVLSGEHYVLNGTKHFITNGGFAGTILVFAKTDPAAAHRGMSCLIVEKGQAGFSTGKHEDKMGIRGSDTCELIFEDCQVPVENRVGAAGDGFKIAMSALDSGRIGVSAQALGIAEAALESAVSYAKTRQQFGQPIANFQFTQFTLADMATRVEAARQLVYRAAMTRDAGVRFSTEAAMAKLFASEAAGYVTTKALQIHGGYGYMKDYPIERYFRDAKITEIYEGTSEVQRMVIANSLLRG